MEKKLTWEEIRKQYDQQWVELVDYDWPEEDEHPHTGIVRVHSSDRAEFYRLAAIDSPKDSALVFVGKHKPVPGKHFSPGMRRLVPSHA